jgi:hypothetical protein
MRLPCRRVESISNRLVAGMVKLFDPLTELIRCISFFSGAIFLFVAVGYISQ